MTVRNHNRTRQGMNWIRPVKRLAIYIRDGFACVYCGLGVENGVSLTLDHLKPFTKGGHHDHGNLVTCCRNCNTFRGNRTWRGYVSRICDHREDIAKPIIGRILAAKRRALPLAQAKDMIQQRGGLAAVLNEKREKCQ